MIRLFKWSGTLAGVFGCYVMAANTPLSKYAFFIYLFSSTTLLYAALRERDHFYSVLNTAFLVGNLVGIYRWVLA